MTSDTGREREKDATQLEYCQKETTYTVIFLLHLRNAHLFESGRSRGRLRPRLWFSRWAPDGSRARCCYAGGGARYRRPHLGTTRRRTGATLVVEGSRPVFQGYAWPPATAYPLTAGTALRQTTLRRDGVGAGPHASHPSAHNRWSHVRGNSGGRWTAAIGIVPICRGPRRVTRSSSIVMPCCLRVSVRARRRILRR